MKKLIAIFIAVILLIPNGVWAAIAYVSDAQSTRATNTFTHTLSYTVADGTDRILFVGTSCDDNDGINFDLTSVTFNGDALTFIDKNVGVADTNYTELWYMVAPDVGTFNIVITDDDQVSCDGLIISGSNFTGVAQSSPIDAFIDGGSAVDGDPSVNINTNTAGVWLIDMTSVGTAFTTATVGASQDERWNTNVSNHLILGSTEITTSPGTYTMSWALSTDRAWNSVVAAFKASDTAVANPSDLTIGTKNLIIGTKNLIIN